MPKAIESTKTPVKKGKKSWKPAQMLKTSARPGKKVRWCRDDPANIQKKMAEGWEPVSKVHGAAATHEHPEQIVDGKPTGSVTEYRDMVLMQMPTELVEARSEYYRERTERQTIKSVKEAAADEQRLAREHGVSSPGIYTPEGHAGKLVID